MNYEEIQGCFIDWFADMDNFLSASDLYHWPRTLCDDCFKARAKALLETDEVRKTR